MGLHLSGRRAAVLGRPINHSLSPVLHRAAYAELGLTGWTYDAVDCGADELPALVAAAGPEWIGYSITMPGKRAALATADHVSPRAGLVGAANTLVRGPDGAWTADNTDVEGIRRALAPLPIASPDITLLGAGGTAQAAVIALAELPGRRLRQSIDVLVRDRSRVGELRRCAERAGVGLRVTEFGDPGIDRVLGLGGLIVSTLPAGAADVLAGRPWPASTTLLDAIYHPWPTVLAAAVTAAGGAVAGGREILLFQAAAQVELMTGLPAPLEAMRAALPS